VDPGIRSPIVDFFRRGEVASDVRLLAAQGAFAPGPLEQLALLLVLVDDADPAVATTARQTIDKLPPAAVAKFIGRKDVPAQMRDFFKAYGIEPVEGAADDPVEPLVPEADAEPLEETADPVALSSLGVVERMKLAMKGTREQRGQLIRDSNKLVSAAVLSSPKVNESEIEAYAKMGNVSEDVLRIIGTNRAWTKSYAIFSALVKNPKTPPAISLQFVQRLNEKDLKKLTTDRNAPESVRLAAKKYVKK
jgi:hypothetical protein